MNIFIILFILLINVINIFAIYKLLGKDIKNKEKIIFIAVGVAIMYMLVSVVYWLSSIGMDKNAEDAGRDTGCISEIRRISYRKLCTACNPVPYFDGLISGNL